MKHLCVSLGVILSVASVAFAQQSASPTTDAPAAKEDIQHLFEVMQIHQQMRQVMDAMLNQQSTMMHETLKRRYPQTSAEKIARADRMIEEATKDLPLDAMLDDMIPIYQKHFSKADIDAMRAFYASPTGQKKMLQEMPALTTESMQASYARMQKQMDAMMQRAEQIMKEDQEKPTSKAPSPPSQQKD